MTKRRGVVKKLQIAIAEGASAVKDFAWENSIPEPNSGCWLWEGSLSKYGYAYVCDPRAPINRKSPRRVFIHRLVCEMHSPNFTDALLVRHTCDNPICVNPDHLLPGTHMDNYLDSVKRKRRPSYKGEKNRKAKLTASDVMWVRSVSDMKVPDIAKRLNVCESTIWQIKRNVIWTHLNSLST